MLSKIDRPEPYVDALGSLFEFQIGQGEYEPTTLRFNGHGQIVQGAGELNMWSVKPLFKLDEEAEMQQKSY